MKKLYFTIFFAIFFSSWNLHAQLQEEERSMSNGFKNALVLTIPNAEARSVEKLWRDFLKDYDGKPKRVKGNRDEWLSDDADIPGIGLGNSVDVYTTFNQTSENVEMIAWFDLGGSYLNSAAHGDRYVEGEKFMMRFGLLVTKELIQEELSEQEKKLQDLENDMKRLARDNERLHADIEEAKRIIAESEAAIKLNVQAQKEKEKEIEGQQQTVETVRKKLKDF